jgi:hypothetical protein
MHDVRRAARTRPLIVAIKGLHSLLFLLMSAAILYVLHSGLTGTRGPLLGFALGLITLEGLVLVANRRRCPLTTLALRLGDATGDDYLTDWFVPRSAVRATVPFCGGLFALGLVLLGVALVLGR